MDVPGRAKIGGGGDVGCSHSLDATSPIGPPPRQFWIRMPHAKIRMPRAEILDAPRQDSRQLDQPRIVRDEARACDAGRMSSNESATSIDELDARLLRELDAAPRVGVLEMSRRLGVARATVQARLDRLVRRGVIASFAPTLDPDALGFQVTAFATLEIRQGRGVQVLDHLRGIPEVLEVHTITGQGDMLCRLVARSNDDLQHVIDRVTEFPEIVRTSTVIALSNPISHRVLPLVSR
jgi:DNA-binding Lrp family transcriptional regulator